jgi:hypothetical protein
MAKHASSVDGVSVSTVLHSQPLQSQNLEEGIPVAFITAMFYGEAA